MGIAVDGGGDFGSGELGMGEEHERRAGAHPDRDDAVGMKRGHHIGPDAAAGVSPESPGDGLQFGVTGLGGEIAEGLEEGLFRAAARIEPQLRSLRARGRFSRSARGSWGRAGRSPTSSPGPASAGHRRRWRLPWRPWCRRRAGGR